MTQKKLNALNATNAANITTTPVSGDDALGAVTLAGAATATYSSTAEKYTNYRSARLQQTSGTDRARIYHTFTATDTFSLSFHFRWRSDPAAANTMYTFVDTAFAGPADLRLNTVSGSRHLCLFVAGSQVKDFGQITSFGSTTASIYGVQMYGTRNATTGSIHCKAFDSSGSALGTEYIGTGLNTGSNQWIRSQWGGSTGVAMDLDIFHMFTDDNSTPYYPALFTPPVAPPTLAALTGLQDYIGIVAAGQGAAGSGGTLSYSISPTTGVIEPVDGIFYVPRDVSSGSDYTATVTVTESPSGQTATRNVTIPKQAIGTNVHAPQYHTTGTLPNSNWG